MSVIAQSQKGYKVYIYQGDTLTCIPDSDMTKVRYVIENNNEQAETIREKDVQLVAKDSTIGAYVKKEVEWKKDSTMAADQHLKYKGEIKAWGEKYSKADTQYKNQKKINWVLKIVIGGIVGYEVYKGVTRE